MSTPSRPPQHSAWAPVASEREREREARVTQSPPERRAEVAIAEGARATASALQVALGKASARVRQPAAQVHDERVRERRSAKRRRLAIVWGRRAGYLVIAASLVWVVLLSPVFGLDPAKVQVSGYGTVVDPTAVRAVVEADEGASLATLSVGHLSNQLKDIPGVREAHVQRSWPNGLVITLESREPVAALPDPTGGFALVDDEGVQVGRAAKVPKELPELAVPAGNEKVLRAALGVLAALPAALRDRVDQIQAGTEDSVSFALHKGPTVEWGSAEDSAVKAQVLQVLLTSKQARGADVIDVSAPTLPITKNN